MEQENRFDQGRIPDGLEGIVEEESVDSQLTFALPEQRDANGNPIEGKAFWMRFRGEQNETAEGKLFLPEGKSNDSLVLFEGGLPGDSASWLEGKHVPAFLEKGYTALVMRHLGTKTDAEGAEKYVHSPERIARGQETGETAIGGTQEFSLLDIAREPAVALKALGNNFSRIVMVGHSAGALNNAYAIRELPPETQKKVENFVALAGYLGGVDERKENFSDLKGYYEYCRRFINMGGPEKNIEQVKTLHDRVLQDGLPEETMVTLVNAPQDEYLPLTGAEKFQDTLGRGLRIVDETESEPEFHNLKNLRPETLVRLAEMRYPKSKHTVSVRERAPRK